jgi:hypothetical protein
LQARCALDLFEFTDRRLVNASKPIELGQEQTRMVDGALACTRIANSKNDCQEFGVGQGLGTLVEQPFSRPIVFRPILDGLIASHEHLDVVSRVVEPMPISGRGIRLPY